MRFAVSVPRFAAMVAVLIGAVAPTAVLDAWPAYRQIGPDEAVVKLSFTHGADRSADCHRNSPEDLAKLPPNMRRPMACPRGRRAVLTELEIDGRVIHAETVAPTGLAGDGPSQLYRRFRVPAGPHRLAVRLRDSARAEGFDHEAKRDVTLAPGQNFTIDFRPDAGGFVLR
ncbi:carboxypeptidase-like regulatory domain-containing protein [Prosthecomicrobium sp. N25]|uniref:carboxypeptidase-like regulatory domain-containing protein n=1 Tax=Prosthecomicrobium sp. N25 TaxID=3129254 RepID=UPI003076ED9C